MDLVGTVFLRHIRLRFLLPSFLFALCICLYPPSAGGQDDAVPEIYGYVTAVHSPSSFDVNTQPVTTSPETRFGLMGDKNPSSSSPLRASIRVGLFVHVEWPPDSSEKTSAVATVFVRDEKDKPLSGTGLIDKVIATGAEPVFQADGYRIRITSATQVSFQGELKSLADVGTNTLVRFEGKRDKTGDLVANQAAFTPVEPKKLEPLQKPVGQIPVPNQGAIIDTDGRLRSLHTKIRYEQSNSFCGWFKVPADPALQARVQNIGIKLIPAYQKQLSDKDPSKIDFRFYAVDAPRIRSDLVCTPGLVLVPMQVAELLRNDDQLAAVVADGIAFNLQWQVIRETENADLVEFGKIAEDVAVVYDPIDFVIAEHSIGAVVSHARREGQARMALTLMADAGYDPWQAPEAWHLLAPKKLPKNQDTLDYPSRSRYQLSILNLQNKSSGGAAAGK